METSPVKDALQARHLGTPADYVAITGFLPWEALDEISAELRLSPGGLLADIACGRGGYGIAVAKRSGARLSGVDFSAVALKQAQLAAATLLGEGWAQFTEGTFTSTGLAESTVDALLCTDSVQFAEPRVDALTEFRRVLRPGGRLALTTWQAIRPDPALPTRLRNLDLRRDLQAAGFTEIVVARRARWLALERALHEEAVSLPNDGEDAALADLQAESVRSLSTFGSIQRIVVFATAP
nr:class I SAM-dependent methyltransferase [Kineosporia babensis]